MIDAWNDNLKDTSLLKKDVKDHNDKLEKHNQRISELEKRQSDYALKSDIEKLKMQVTSNSEKILENSEKIQDLRKFVENEIIIIMKAIDQCAKKDEMSLLRTRVENLEKMFRDLKKLLD